MHLDHDHVAGHSHEETPHTHTHTHADGTTHSHPHTHPHDHDHEHECDHNCETCPHTPMEELVALMQYMVGHNAAHARELAQLAEQLEKAGSHTAYEQVMAAVSDFEKGNMRLSAVLASLK